MCELKYIGIIYIPMQDVMLELRITRSLTVIIYYKLDLITLFSKTKTEKKPIKLRRRSNVV